MDAKRVSRFGQRHPFGGVRGWFLTSHKFYVSLHETKQNYTVVTNISMQEFSPGSDVMAG